MAYWAEAYDVADWSDTRYKRILWQAKSGGSWRKILLTVFLVQSWPHVRTFIYGASLNWFCVIIDGCMKFCISIFMLSVPSSAAYVTRRRMETYFPEERMPTSLSMAFIFPGNRRDPKKTTVDSAKKCFTYLIAAHFWIWLESHGCLRFSREMRSYLWLLEPSTFLPKHSCSSFW